MTFINRSAFASVATQLPQWQTLPGINFTQGVGGQTVNLANYVTWNGNSPGNWVFSVTNGYSLETGVSLSGSGILSYDGSSPVASATVEFDLNTTAQADWIARSTASGVVGAENFSGWANVTAWWDAWYNGTMSAGGWFISSGKNPHTDPSQFAQSVAMQAVAGHQRTGNSLRIYMGEYQYQATGTNPLDNTWVNQYFTFNPSSTPASAFLQTFYVQITIWTDAYVDYAWNSAGYGAGPAPGSKFFRLDDQRGTENGEIVCQNAYQQGFCSFYRRSYTGNSNNNYERAISTPANNNNLAQQPAIDNGGVLTDEQSYHKRYGPMYYGMLPALSQSSLLHTQANTPDPGSVIGGIPWNRGGMTTIECFVDLVPGHFMAWAAPTGSAPKKFVDETDSDHGSENWWGNRVMTDGTGWNTIELTPLVYLSDSNGNPGYPHNYVDYSEIIISTQPIKFPGGFSLP